MIQNIIFDFGGVILTHKSTLMEEILTSMFPTSAKKAITLFLKHKTNLQTSKESSRDFITLLKRELKSNLEVNKLLKIWEEEYKKAAQVNRTVLNLVKDLNKNYNTYLFTDTIDIHDKYNSGRNIYNNFKRVFKSFEEKLRKPDKKAYINVLTKIGARANECIFIDDLVKNIEAAEEVGMKSIVYKNIEKLKKELDKFGVKI